MKNSRASRSSKLRRIIIESITNNTLSRDEELDLLFLIHDKKHVASFGKIIPGLEKAIKIYSTRCNGYLHRGVTGKEAKYIASLDVGDIFQNPGYSSFSRRPDIARKFAKSYQTEEMPIVLELERGTKAFDYNSWIFNFWYNKMGTQLFWDNDAPDIMELAEEEQEWILPRNSKFEITKIRKAFKCLNFEVTLK